MNYLREIRLSELPKSYAGRIPAVRYLFEVGGLKFQKNFGRSVSEMKSLRHLIKSLTDYAIL